VPVPAQAPAIDDIANEEDRIGVVVLQKIQQEIGLRTFRAEMNIGQKKRTEFSSLDFDHHADLR
jgi:hypothetical protein